MIEPMTLADMRALGPRTIEAFCMSCDHSAIIEADTLPPHYPVPDVALKLRCSECGSKDIQTRPNWRARRGRESSK